MKEKIDPINPIDTTDSIDLIDPFVLEKLRVATRKVLFDHDLDYMAENLEVRCEDFGRNIALDFRSLILGLPDKERIDIEESWPEDWWEAFRERWFLDWWLKKYPIKRKKISIHQQIYKAVCPHSNMKTEENKHWIEFYHSFVKPVRGEK